MTSAALATHRMVPATPPVAAPFDPSEDDLGGVLVALIAGQGLSSLLARLIALRDRLEECRLPAQWRGRRDAGRQCARLAALCRLAVSRVERLGRLRAMDAPAIVQRNEERMLVAALRALLEAGGPPHSPPVALPPGSGSSTSTRKESSK